ncbi:MAG: MogA/MoaB family molybdenum cofactor biosynthesis protein [Phycisphaerales bacterium]|jgi:molybdenum cofactor biosynthesis protein B|nr:MogA/MoaB family molybdenum cofactor biosynthesis protein [Phycisphaerales bacterium]
MDHERIATARFAVLTVSDTRSKEEDLSGARICALLEEAGHSICAYDLVQDEASEIVLTVSGWSEDASIDAIIVTGGTGPAPRDVTPEAVVPLFSSTLQGFGELFRHLSYNEIGASAMLSRAEAGLIDEGKQRTAVFLLPGSPNAIELAMSKLIIPEIGHLLAVCQGKNTI